MHSAQGRRDELHARRLRHAGQRVADGGVRGDAARDGQHRRPVRRAQRAAGLFRQHIRHRLLEAGAEIRAVGAAQSALLVPSSRSRARRTAVFRPEKRQVAARPVQQRPRQGEAGGIALRGLGLDRGAAGLGQAEQLRDLVERLARRVVDRAAEPGEIVGAVHEQELAMPARDQQHQVGERHAVGQPRRQRVAGKVVDPDQRQAGSRAQPLGAHHARQDAADQPRPGGHGDAVQIAQAQPRFGQRLFDAAIQLFRMGARGDFRHHAAEIGMQRGLRRRRPTTGSSGRTATTAAAVSSQLLSMPRKVSVILVPSGEGA